MLDDLRAMTLFVRTVELGSFRAAAKASNLSPSVVSHHIQQLEKKYGVALLYRSTRKLAQTDEGRRFYERARQMVAAAAGAVDVLTGEAASPYGKLTVSLPAAQVRGAITRKVAEFAELHPYVHLKLVCTDEPVDLFAGGVDVALRAGTLKDSSLKSKRVGSVGRTPRLLAALLGQEGRSRSSGRPRRVGLDPPDSSACVAPLHPCRRPDGRRGLRGPHRGRQR